jgi:putative peptidoglycan binding protein
VTQPLTETNAAMTTDEQPLCSDGLPPDPSNGLCADGLPLPAANITAPPPPAMTTEDLQACAEGQVFNPETMTCEPAAGGEGGEQQQEQEPQASCAEGQVFNPETMTCEPAAGGEGGEQQAPWGGVEIGPAQIEEEQPATGGEVQKNYESLKYICNPNSETLQVGSQGNKVKELQTYLTDLGYGILLKSEGTGLSVKGIDGKFGPHTKNSVIAYQKDNTLSVDGIVGPQTWTSLCKDVDNILSNNVPILK